MAQLGDGRGSSNAKLTPPRCYDGSWSGTLTSKPSSWATSAGALQITVGTATALLYEPPRSLMLEVFPHAVPAPLHPVGVLPVRGGAGPPDTLSSDGVHPLPDFVPANLFSDLNLPEVTVILPPANQGDEETISPWPSDRRCACWCRGTLPRRFAPQRGNLRHWLPVPLDGSPYACPLNAYLARREFVADVPLALDGGLVTAPCFRPWTIRPQKLSDPSVLTTSRGWLHWQLQAILPEQGHSVRVPEHHAWQAFFPELEFYLHAFRAPATVRPLRPPCHRRHPPLRRLAYGCDPLRRRPGRKRTPIPAARRRTVGFEVSVDTLEPNCSSQAAPPSSSAPVSQCPELAHRVLARNGSQRSATRHTHKIRFEREWLEQIYLTSLLVKGWRNEQGLEEASAALDATDPGRFSTKSCRPCSAFSTPVPQVLERTPKATNPTEATKPTASTRPGAPPQFGASCVLPRCSTDCAPAAQFCGARSTGGGHPGSPAVHETAGEALLQACSRWPHARRTSIPWCSTSPSQRGRRRDHTSGGSEVHSPPESAAPLLEVLLSETTVGGAGVLEQLARTIAGEPRRLAQALHRP